MIRWKMPQTEIILGFEPRPGTLQQNVQATALWKDSWQGQDPGDILWSD